MSTLALEPRGEAAARSGFAPWALAVAVVSAALAGLAPRGFSIATVFLFAGPHNWMEARYFLARLPARWGPLRAYFVLGLAGAVVLALASALLPAVGSNLAWSGRAWAFALAGWESALVLWVLGLILLRSRQKPVRDWSLAVPVGGLLLALAWAEPAWWGLALVYGHPFMAFAVLDRELRRSRQEWRASFRRILWAVPVLLVFLVVGLAGTPDLPGDDPITSRIARHAGSELLSGVSSHLLVATHTFLEMLHYGVWLVAIPLASLGTAPWNVSSAPLARSSPRWRRLLSIGLGIGLAVVVLLWAAFLADYSTARDVYFRVAMLHVLAEIPFLIRML